jgi:hypothetical protein
MTTEATIGPLEFVKANVFEDDEIKRDGTEKMSIWCSPSQAKQILGLCGDVVKNNYGGLRVVSSRNSRWGVMPVEGSIYVATNEAIAHNGLYKLVDAEEEYKHPNYSLVKITAEMLSRNVNEPLTLNHTKGGEDLAVINSRYEDKDEVIILEDEFTGAYTDNWTTYESYYLSGGSIATSGGKLVFTGAKTGSPGYGGWGRIKTYNKFTNTPPFTFEFDMEYIAGTGGKTNLQLIMVESTPQSWNLLQNGSTSNYIRFYIYYSGSTLYFGVVRCKAGSAVYLVSQQALNISTEKNPNFKVEYNTDGSMSIYIDKTGGTTFGDPIWTGKTGFLWSSPDFIWNMNTTSTSAATMKSGNFKTYTEEEVSKPNVVVAPPDAFCNLTPDFTRASEDGLIQCFKNPLDPLNYQITPANFYKGTVKGWNGNYSDSVYRLVTHNGMDLDPTKFYVSNGLIKLITTSTGVALYGWNGSAYVLVNTFTLPNPIRLIRPFMVTPWEFTLQLDRTYWTIRAGKPYVYVKHPYDDIGMTLKNNCYHDNSLTSWLTADYDITMDDVFYALFFNSYNILTTNQYGIESGTTGWEGTGATISQDPDSYTGNYALKAITNDSAVNEGIQENANYYAEVPVTPTVGLPIFNKTFLKGSGTVQLFIYERDVTKSILTSHHSGTITLTSSYLPAYFTSEVTHPDTRYITMKVLTPTRQAATIYMDSSLVGPIPVYPHTDPIIVAAPTAANRYGLVVTKKDPCTIKSDSIPASSLTGLGVYDQMQPPTTDDYFVQLAREWHKPTQQALALQSI